MSDLIPVSERVSHFAEMYRVRTRRDDCGELVIPGSRGHVYEHDAGHLGVMLLFSTARRWNFMKRKLMNAGFRLKQNATTEGSLLFDPTNDEQARLALSLVRARFRRKVSQKQLAHLARLNAAA